MLFRSLNVLRAVKCINIYQNNCDTAYREADILKNLRHPSIPIIYDIEQDSEHIYVIEEYIEGMSLTQLISQQKLCAFIIHAGQHIKQYHTNGIYITPGVNFLFSIHLR